MTRNPKTTKTDSDDVDYDKNGERKQKRRRQTKDFPGADIGVPHIVIIVLN